MGSHRAAQNVCKQNCLPHRIDFNRDFRRIRVRFCPDFPLPISIGIPFRGSSEVSYYNLSQAAAWLFEGRAFSPKAEHQAVPLPAGWGVPCPTDRAIGPAPCCQSPTSPANAARGDLAGQKGWTELGNGKLHRIAEEDPAPGAADIRDFLFSFFKRGQRHRLPASPAVLSGSE